MPLGCAPNGMPAAGCSHTLQACRVPILSYVFQHESSMSLYKATWHAGLGESISERHGEGGWDMHGICSACQGDALRAAHAETATRCALPSWQLPARRLGFTGTPRALVARVLARHSCRSILHGATRELSKGTSTPLKSRVCRTPPHGKVSMSQSPHIDSYAQVSMRTRCAAWYTPSGGQPRSSCRVAT